MTTKLDRTLKKLEKLGYRIQRLAGTAQCVVDEHNGARTPYEQAVEHFAYELVEHGHKLSELIEIAQDRANSAA